MQVGCAMQASQGQACSAQHLDAMMLRARAGRRRQLAQDNAAWTALTALQGHEADLHSLLQLGTQGSLTGQCIHPGLQFLQHERPSVRDMQQDVRTCQQAQASPGGGGLAHGCTWTAGAQGGLQAAMAMHL